MSSTPQLTVISNLVRRAGGHCEVISFIEMDGLSKTSKKGSSRARRANGNNVITVNLPGLPGSEEGDKPILMKDSMIDYDNADLTFTPVLEAWTTTYGSLSDLMERYKSGEQFTSSLLSMKESLKSLKDESGMASALVAFPNRGESSGGPATASNEQALAILESVRVAVRSEIINQMMEWRKTFLSDLNEKAGLEKQKLPEGLPENLSVLTAIINKTLQLRHISWTMTVSEDCCTALNILGDDGSDGYKALKTVSSHVMQEAPKLQQVFQNQLGAYSAEHRSLVDYQSSHNLSEYTKQMEKIINFMQWDQHKDTERATLFTFNHFASSNMEDLVQMVTSADAKFLGDLLAHVTSTKSKSKLKSKSKASDPLDSQKKDARQATSIQHSFNRILHAAKKAHPQTFIHLSPKAVAEALSDTVQRSASDSASNPNTLSTTGSVESGWKLAPSHIIKPKTKPGRSAGKKKVKSVPQTDNSKNSTQQSETIAKHTTLVEAPLPDTTGMPEFMLHYIKTSLEDIQAEQKAERPSQPRDLNDTLARLSVEDGAGASTKKTYILNGQEIWDLLSQSAKEQMRREDDDHTFQSVLRSADEAFADVRGRGKTENRFRSSSLPGRIASDADE